jgi:putative flippase GtrA
MAGLATVADWGSFFLLNQVFRIDYRLALAGSTGIGSLTNFWLNKRFTFRDPTRKLGAQLAVYAVLTAVSLSCSCLIMSVQVDWLKIHPMVARMLTTAIMVTANFALNKFVTFNRRLFRDRAIERPIELPASQAPPVQWDAGSTPPRRKAPRRKPTQCPAQLHQGRPELSRELVCRS